MSPASLRNAFDVPARTRRIATMPSTISTAVTATMTDRRLAAVPGSFVPSAAQASPAIAASAASGTPLSSASLRPSDWSLSRRTRAERTGRAGPA